MQSLISFTYVKLINFYLDVNGNPCQGCILSSDPIDFNAAWKCDKCGEVRRWEDDDLAGIENNLSSRLDDNEKDIKVIRSQF